MKWSLKNEQTIKNAATICINPDSPDPIRRSANTTYVSFIPPEAIEYLITQKSEPKCQRHPQLMIKYISLDPPDVTK